MKALILGANGQVGRALTAHAPKEAQVTALGSDALDITDRDKLLATIGSLRPDLLFNAAAYTAVDKAEDEEATAQAVNGEAVGWLAEGAAATGAKLVHISTDFVFDGARSTPYPPEAAPNPLGAYGRTKLAGERAVGADALIVRTAWVYAATGNNFVRTMLRLMSSQPQIRVVADQIGTPTSANSLAGVLWSLARQDATGLYHHTDSGVASWYDFAVAIQEEALDLGLLTEAAPVVPVATADYPTRAVRPPYSVLDKSRTFAALGGPAPHWRVNLRLTLKDIADHG